MADAKHLMPAVATAARTPSPTRAERSLASRRTIPLYPRARMDGTLDSEALAAGRTSEAWLAALRSEGPARESATRDLHGLLLRAARFELRRRPAALGDVRGEELEDIAVQAADDALAAVLAKLDDFRRASRFTTWAYKFVLLEAGVKLRRRAWQGREVLLEPQAWPSFADGRSSAHETLERNELLRALRSAIERTLTAHQRQVFVALALNEVPIDVLAERLGTSRGALYKALHDARRKLRNALAAEGLAEVDEDATASGEHR